MRAPPVLPIHAAESFVFLVFSLFIARALADPISPRSLNYAGNYLISPGAPPRQGERRANFGNYRLTRFLIKAPDPFARSTTL